MFQFRYINHCFQVNLPWLSSQWTPIGSVWCFSVSHRGCHPSRPSTPLPPHPVIGSELRPQHHWISTVDFEATKIKALEKRKNHQQKYSTPSSESRLREIAARCTSSRSWLTTTWRWWKRTLQIPSLGTFEGVTFWGKHALWPIPKRAVNIAKRLSPGWNNPICSRIQLGKSLVKASDPRYPRFQGTSQAWKRQQQHVQHECLACDNECLVLLSRNVHPTGGMMIPI
jgi:hypothetical protein